VLGALVAAGAASAAGTSLDSALLRPGQVGTGYAVSKSRGLKQATLDLCFRDYPSEHRRVARVQVGYSREGKQEVSNEIVRYQAGGAQQALHEVALAVCKDAKRTSGSTSLTMTARRGSTKGAPAGSVALEVDLVVVSGGRRAEVRGAGVYFARGNVFSGVYAYGPQAAALARAVRLARVSAANLKRA